MARSTLAAIDGQERLLVCSGGYPASQNCLVSRTGSLLHSDRAVAFRCACGRMNIGSHRKVRVQEKLRMDRKVRTGLLRILGQDRQERRRSPCTRWYDGTTG